MDHVFASLGHLLNHVLALFSRGFKFLCFCVIESDHVFFVGVCQVFHIFLELFLPFLQLFFEHLNGGKRIFLSGGAYAKRFFQ